MDENQIVEDAVEALNAMQREFSDDALGELAAAMRYQIVPPMFNSVIRKGADAESKQLTKLREMMRKSPAEFVDAADTVIKRRAKKPPTYKTAVYKCLDDYETCKQRNCTNQKICKALLAICVGRHIIPFVKAID